MREIENLEKELKDVSIDLLYENGALNFYEKKFNYFFDFVDENFIKNIRNAYNYTWCASKQIGIKKVKVSEIKETNHSDYIRYFDEYGNFLPGKFGKRHKFLDLSGVNEGWANLDKMEKGDFIELAEHPSHKSYYTILSGNNRCIASLNKQSEDSEKEYFVQAYVFSGEWNHIVKCLEYANSITKYKVSVCIQHIVDQIFWREQHIWFKICGESLSFFVSVIDRKEKILQFFQCISGLEKLLMKYFASSRLNIFLRIFFLNKILKVLKESGCESIAVKKK